MASRTCYFISGSPPCWTVMLALAVKGLEYEGVRLSNSKGEQKESGFLAVNPRGNVPTLTDDDLTVRETNAILAYLDRAYPEPVLFGETPAKAAAIWQVVEEAGDRFRTPVGNVCRPIFRGRAEAAADEIREIVKPVHTELASYEAMLDGHDYLCGSTITAADVAVYPALQQLLRGATREGAEALELGVYPLVDHYPNLAAWAQRIEAIPGYDEAYPPHWK